jgi:uncharacterized membrane protein YkvA (DUF1232 family)
VRSASGAADGMVPMPWWANALIALAIGLLVSWLLLLVGLLRLRPSRGAVAEALRLGPDIVRLISRLARDASLPRGLRTRLWLLLAYLVTPIDLVPDFIPVIGYADDAIIIVATLRSVVRRAGAEPIGRHWPGSADGLAVVHRLAGLDRAS